MKFSFTKTRKLLNTNYIFILSGIISISMFGSLLVYILEPGIFKTMSDALWWAVVTMTTVGYGDIVPKSGAGQMIAVMVILSGIVFVSLFTATISSNFITRKIREGRGLEKITFKDHIIICGWNENSENLIDTLSALTSKNETLKIVLTNTMSEDDIDNIVNKHTNLDIKFVKGDYTKVPILEKANVSNARSVIIVPNNSIDNPEPDEKTVLATLTVKSISPNTHTIAFIINIENRSHLKRASADEIYVKDEFSGYILASHVLAPGISQTYYNLMSNKIHPSMFRQNVPSEFIGKTFREYFDYCRKNEKSMLLGFITEYEKASITDFLSADNSQLDAFIERKLRMAGHSLHNKGRIEVNLNPDDDYIVKEKDIAVLIQ